MPLCRHVSQVGCVITFASFRDNVPPSPGAFFGSVPGEGMESGCTNPAALDGGKASLHAYLTGAGYLIVGAAMQQHHWVEPGTDTYGGGFIASPKILPGDKYVAKFSSVGTFTNPIE